MSYKKKLIDVAIPLAAINKASAREKSIRHGHPSTLHLWWARRPLAACRAVLFASLVDDPSSNVEKFPTIQAQATERKRLFKMLEDLVLWENSANDELLAEANEEIKSSNNGICPEVYDPFCGGGSIPLEAQRLGLKAYGTDLNPVAVMITKALIEMPMRFSESFPVNPGERQSKLKQTRWKGATGLSQDIKYYGEIVRERAFEKLKDLYPAATLPKEMGGGQATIIAWIWARTVESPNPAFKGIHVPLVRSFWLSTKKGRKTWVEPIISKNKKSYKFDVVIGTGKPSIEGTVSRSGGICLLSGTSIPFSYIREQSRLGLLGKKLMAVVVETKSGRKFLPPDHVEDFNCEDVASAADVEIENWPGRTNTVTYGLTSFRDLFTEKQLCTLSTFSEVVKEIHSEILTDAKSKGLKNDNIPFEDGGSEARAYADTVAAYLGFAIDRCANTLCSLARWTPDREQTVTVFARQALPMTWDFPEVNPFADAAGDFRTSLGAIVKTISVSSTVNRIEGSAKLADAMEKYPHKNVVISTDPPYFDNISYSNLSDFFYVWLRASLKDIFPNIFRTIAVPRATELVANPYRHNGKVAAEKFFRDGMTKALERIKEAATDEVPVTIYYAFKQTEEDDEEDDSVGVASTGWESFLEALVAAGFSIHGTWPLRTELGNRMLGAETNALASSIVLTCRRRDPKAKSATRREFVAALKNELPLAIANLRETGIAAVDLQQSAIGPGMAVYSRNESVLDSNDSKMGVRSALILINQVLDEVLAESDSMFDSQTRWAISWFEQYGFAAGPFGDATTLAQAKNIGVDSLANFGIITSRAGKVSLTSTANLNDAWVPKDGKGPVWLNTLHMIKSLEELGEAESSVLLRALGASGNSCRDLAYRCFAICQRNSWIQDAARFNSLVISWAEMQRQANTISGTQGSLGV